MTLRVVGTRIEGNWSNHEGGSGDLLREQQPDGLRGDRRLDRCATTTGDGFQTYPGIFFLGDSITFTNSTVE